MRICEVLSSSFSLEIGDLQPIFSKLLTNKNRDLKQVSLCSEQAIEPFGGESGCRYQK